MRNERTPPPRVPLSSLTSLPKGSPIASRSLRAATPAARKEGTNEERAVWLLPLSVPSPWGSVTLSLGTILGSLLLPSLWFRLFSVVSVPVPTGFAGPYGVYGEKSREPVGS